MSKLYLPCLSIGEQILEEGPVFQWPEQELFAHNTMQSCKMNCHVILGRKICNVSLLFLANNCCFFAQWWLKYQLNRLKCKNCSRDLCEYHAFMCCAMVASCKTHHLQCCVFETKNECPKKWASMPRFGLLGTQNLKVQLLHEIAKETKQKIKNYLRIDDFVNFHVILVPENSNWQTFIEPLGTHTSYLLIELHSTHNLIDAVRLTLKNFMQSLVNNSKELKLDWKKTNVSSQIIVVF